jgi:hypothetical protein
LEKVKACPPQKSRYKSIEENQRTIKILTIDTDTIDPKKHHQISPLIFSMSSRLCW